MEGEHLGGSNEVEREGRSRVVERGDGDEDVMKEGEML